MHGRSAPGQPLPGLSRSHSASSPRSSRSTTLTCPVLGGRRCRRRGQRRHHQAVGPDVTRPRCCSWGVFMRCSAGLRPVRACRAGAVPAGGAGQAITRSAGGLHGQPSRPAESGCSRSLRARSLPASAIESFGQRPLSSSCASCSMLDIAARGVASSPSSTPGRCAPYRRADLRTMRRCATPSSKTSSA